MADLTPIKETRPAITYYSGHIARAKINPADGNFTATILFEVTPANYSAAIGKYVELKALCEESVVLDKWEVFSDPGCVAEVLARQVVVPNRIPDPEEL